MKRAPVIGSFDEFFDALWRRNETKEPIEPFPWQRTLAETVAGAMGVSGWPEVLALPTASGKTACLDIAIYALAAQAHRPAADRTAPRRIFFVVDRRVIVDEAFARARRIAERLATAEDGILGDIATALRRIGGLDDDGPPLACFELRGGLYRDDAWARTPTQPTIVASTVDQVGSRLLFRGYGTSARSRPLHAGLAAHDSLILLDEAHCSAAFGETVRAVAGYRADRWAERPVRSPFAFVEMTATPRRERERLELQDTDREHPVLRLRLQADKPVRLIGPLAAKVESPAYVRRLCEEAEAHAARGARRIAVMVNRVATARRVFDELAVPPERKVLMTGRMRPLDRDELMGVWGPRLAASEERAEPERPWFVVATQCLEVGANLDFDAMVSECASLDALRQRFGRLNRLGLDSRAAATLVVARESLKGEDFVYGDALVATWAWLSGQAEAAGEDAVVDFGIEAMDRRWEVAVDEDASLPGRLLAPAPAAPVLLPAHLDAWVQTSPVPAPDPDPGVFLHGPNRGRPEVQLCWRADLDPEIPEASEDALSDWIDLLALCPPAAAECLQAPLDAVRRWLRDGTGPGEIADVEGGGTADTGSDDPVLRRRILRWKGSHRSEWLARPSSLRPGDTLVLALEPHERLWLQSEGGVAPPLTEGEQRFLRSAPPPSWSLFGHLPVAEDGVLRVDRGDEAFLQARDRAVLRVHPETLAAWPEGTAKAAFLELTRDAELEARVGEPELVQRVQGLLTVLAVEAASVPWLALAADHLARQPRRKLRVRLHPFGSGTHNRGLVLTAPGRVGRAGGLAPFSSETFGEEDENPLVHAPIPLDEHCERVATLAEAFASGTTLSRERIDDIVLAGRLHDLGKADPRFQAWLHRGSDLAARAAGRALAKSPGLPQPPSERERARVRSRYPKGGRHELVSVRLSESAPQVLAAVADPELVLHLVGSHHGHGRPFAPRVTDDEPIDVRLSWQGRELTACSRTALERIDSGVAERFWRLVRRYGWWGLAYLEAVLILADHRSSEAEEGIEPDRGTAEDEEVVA